MTTALQTTAPSVTPSLDESESSTLTLGIMILLGFAGVFVCMCLVNLAIYRCLGGAQLKDSPVIRSCSCVCCVGCVTDLIIDCSKIPSNIKNSLCALCGCCDTASQDDIVIDIELGDVPRAALVNVPSNTNTEITAQEGLHSMTSQRQRGPLSPPLDSTSSTAMTKQNCAEHTNKDLKTLPPPPPRRESIDTTTGQTQTGPLSPSLNSISRSSNMADFDLLSPIEEGEEQPLCASLDEVELSVVDNQSSSGSPHAAKSHFVFLADSADEEQENPHVH